MSRIIEISIYRRATHRRPREAGSTKRVCAFTDGFSTKIRLCVSESRPRSTQHLPRVRSMPFRLPIPRKDLAQKPVRGYVRRFESRGPGSEGSALSVFASTRSAVPLMRFVASLCEVRTFPIPSSRRV